MVSKINLNEKLTTLVHYDLAAETSSFSRPDDVQPSNKKNDFQIYTVRNYRTQELSWAVQYMSILNRHSNNIIVESNQQEDLSFVSEYYSNLIFKIYTLSQKINKYFILIAVSYLFIFYLIYLVCDLFNQIFFTDNLQDQYESTKFGLLHPEQVFIIFALSVLIMLSLVLINEIVYLASKLTVALSLTGICKSLKYVQTEVAQ